MQITNRTDQPMATTSLQQILQRRGSKLLKAIASNPKIAVGTGIVLFFVFIAVAAPLLTPYNPDLTLVRGAQPPSFAHILGTTALGQDLFAQIVYGARISLLVGFLAAIGSTILQVFFGLTSAYFSGIVDDLLSLLINIFLVLPGLPLTIVLASLASADSAGKNELVIALVLLFTSWSYGARVLRSNTQSLKEREFVAAARASGETAFRIIFAEILPNELTLVASNFVGTFVYAVGAEVALEFLGLGDISKATWGVILYNAQSNSALLTGEWWLFVPAGLCVATLCAGLAFINLGIDEFTNPVLRRRKATKAAKKQEKVVA